MRIIVYIILFLLGYRVLKKFFSPNFGNVDRVNDGQTGRNNTTMYRSDDVDKSNDIEDVDYEEVE
jgi:hypothetical protein